MAGLGVAFQAPRAENRLDEGHWTEDPSGCSYCGELHKGLDESMAV